MTIITSAIIIIIECRAFSSVSETATAAEGELIENYCNSPEWRAPDSESPL